jgi:hypothetical protein
LRCAANDALTNHNIKGETGYTKTHPHHFDARRNYQGIVFSR